MVSIKGRMSSAKTFFLFIIFPLLLGCSIGRVYVGSEIREDPNEKIQIGRTTKGEILRIFGPPERIQRQFDGDVFIYAYLRKNSTKFTIEEPYLTNFTLFQYTKIQQKKDALVILFGQDGVVKSFGFQRGTSELTPF